MNVCLPNIPKKWLGVISLAVAVALLQQVLLATVCAAGSVQGTEPLVDLTRAVVIAPGDLTKPENKAIQMLIEEVEKRTQIRLPRANSRPAGTTTPVIWVGTASILTSFAGDQAARLAAERDVPAGGEGYRIRVAEGTAPGVFVVGNDARGVLFGVGHLLRSLQMTKNRISLPAGFNVATAPKYQLRGHQLGYRPKTNSYDGWTVQMWEQYIRDLVVFGTNAIELIPPRSDDAAESPHFPLPQMQMMIEMSRICDEYGLDVWIWYPALDKDYSDPKTIEFALNEWGEVFKRLPRIDHVMVPGGDPGHTQPVHLMALLEKQTTNLRRYHPKAGMWVAPQGFTKEWMDEFFGILNKRPAWLSGLVYGPQTRISLPQLRAATPKEYPIRHYPDITHTRSSQFPVPDWDQAYAMTEAREPINPRPRDQAHIFRIVQPDAAVGFITYSEGCNDDVNKFVWSALGWNPEADVVDALRDYSRYFIGPQYTDSLAQGLLALERNWQGPLLTNSNVYTTLQQFQSMEQAASSQDLSNWRLQQALYRAYYDAYTRSRLIYETDLEDRAMEKLRGAGKAGSLVAIEQAEAELDKAERDRPAAAWRARIFELAEALYQSIRMQLSVERYKAIAVGRGANLDTVDFPLNNRPWLKQRFAELRQGGDEAARLKWLDEIVNWTNPGPGGFYDDLGNPTRQPHLVKGSGFERDPQFFDSSLTFFADNVKGPRSWRDQAIAFYDAPLRMRYTNLDRSARYKVRAVYGGEVRLLADDKTEIHPLIDKRYQLVEFDIPAEATTDGELTLTWYRAPGGGGPGRGNQIAEVWLIKK